MDYKKYVRNVLNDYNDNIKWDVKEKYEVKFDEYFSFYDVFENFCDDKIILKIRYIVEVFNNKEEFDKVMYLLSDYIDDVGFIIWCCFDLIKKYEKFKDSSDWELFDRWVDNSEKLKVVLDNEEEMEFWMILRDIKIDVDNESRIFGNICNKELYSFLRNRGIWCENIRQ